MKKNNYPSYKLLTSFKKSCRRKRKKRGKRSGWYKHINNIIKHQKATGRLIKIYLPKYRHYTSSLTYPIPPTYSDNINFLAQNPDAFSKELIIPESGLFEIPNPFSLTENFEGSFLFLKKLFYALYKEKTESIILDYGKCERIDVDASVCMDIMLTEFINYYKSCTKRGYKCNIHEITPRNYQKESISKILFSIGAFRNIRGFKIEYDDLTAFPLIIGNNRAKNSGQERELEVTKMGDYIETCLKKMNRTLSWEAENDLSKVIGEVLVNAAEHSGRNFRYAIGYFQETKSEDGHIGVFNLTIFSFGNTIYQTFKRPASATLEAVSRMKELSKKYTSRNWFKSKEFEEETLWTLYALQEGVTSIIDKKRGNGSIHFIESFFRLKGDEQKDNKSCLTIISGSTRIIFDGTYGIKEIPKEEGKHLYKMMTFNSSGNIEDMPDKNYVTFAENFFPGTMISAKIYIKFNNLEMEGNHETA